MSERPHPFVTGLAPASTGALSGTVLVAAALLPVGALLGYGLARQASDGMAHEERQAALTVGAIGGAFLGVAAGMLASGAVPVQST